MNHQSLGIFKWRKDADITINLPDESDPMMHDGKQNNVVSLQSMMRGRVGMQ